MLYKLGEKIPDIDKSCFIAPDATVIGDVKIGEFSSIWFQCVLRGDGNYIEIGTNSNIQDNCVIHIATEKYPALIGNNVTVGHHAVVHAATLQDNSFVGIGATVLDNANVGKFGFVAAGALVPPNFIVPEYTLVAGVPARVVRELKQKDIEMINSTSVNYCALAKEYKKNLHQI